MISSDSQAMGRVGQSDHAHLADRRQMKRQRGRLDGDGARNDNPPRRYIAKYTINPAITHGIPAMKWAPSK